MKYGQKQNIQKLRFEDPNQLRANKRHGSSHLSTIKRTNATNRSRPFTASVPIRNAVRAPYGISLYLFGLEVLLLWHLLRWRLQLCCTDTAQQVLAADTWSGPSVTASSCSARAKTSHIYFEIKLTLRKTRRTLHYTRACVQ